MENPTINTETVLVPASPDGLDYGHHVPATNSPEDTSTLESGQKKPKSARKLFPNIGQPKELELNENENNENKSICNTVTCGIQGGRKTRKRRKKRKQIKSRRNKKGGIKFFGRKPKTEPEKARDETDEERKMSILTRLLGDKYKAQQCYRLNESRKACMNDRQSGTDLPKSCVIRSNLTKQYGRICNPILERAVKIFKAEKEYIRRLKQRNGAGKRRKRKTKKRKSKKLKKTKRRRKR